MIQTPQKIAVIGAGVAGLTSSYLLNQKYDITLFEKDDRIGGNAYTYDTSDGESLDMAVAAYSKLISAEFLDLCKKLDVKMITQPASALLSVHNMETQKGYYLTPLNISGLITQKFALFGPRMQWNIGQMFKGMDQLVLMLVRGELAGLTLAEALGKVPELEEEHRRIPIMASLCLLSSMYYEEVMAGPAEYFVKKQAHLGSFKPMSQMRRLHFPKNFTRSYVEALASPYKDKIVLNARIKSISRDNNLVTLRMEDGQEAVFDKVVFACNADQALALLEKPTDQERKILGVWRYKEGLMVVHKDNTCFPKRSLCQSWTCLQNTRNNMPHFSITICGWRLSPATSNKSVWMATQHPNFDIKGDLFDFEKRFRTPLYDFDSCSTIQELPSLNGHMNSYYCGSHFGLGLHNDAVTSAIEVGKMLGIEWD